MNTLGLNVFIAIVGINAGPGFVQGLIEQGVSLFLWGIVATSVPLLVGLYLGRYVFKFHPAILFGVVAGREDDDGRARHGSGAGQEQSARTRVRHALRGRKHTPYDFGMAVVLLMS